MRCPAPASRWTLSLIHIFYVACAPYLHAGENELRVIARNADQPNSRWYSGAGIYRPVQLWTARSAHIALNGVKIRTLSLDPAVVEVRVKTTAPGTVRLTVDDLPAMQQESDGEAVFTLTLDNARLWTPETPNPVSYTHLPSKAAPGGRCPRRNTIGCWAGRRCGQ